MTWPPPICLVLPTVSFPAPILLSQVYRCKVMSQPPLSPEAPQICHQRKSISSQLTLNLLSTIDIQAKTSSPTAVLHQVSCEAPCLWILIAGVANAILLPPFLESMPSVETVLSTTLMDSPAQEAEIRRLLETLRSTQATSSDSCDQCRSAKVKCSRGATCERCTKQELDCTRHHRLVRRGPPTKKQRVEFEKCGLPYRTFRDRLADRRQSKSGAAGEASDLTESRIGRSRSSTSSSHRDKSSRKASITDSEQDAVIAAAAVAAARAAAATIRGVSDPSTPALSAASTVSSAQSTSFMLDDMATLNPFSTTLDSFNILRDAPFGTSMQLCPPFESTSQIDPTLTQYPSMKPEPVGSWQQQETFQWEMGVDAGAGPADPSPFSAYHFLQAPEPMSQEITPPSPMQRPASVEPLSARTPSDWLKQPRRSYPALFRQPNC